MRIPLLVSCLAIVAVVAVACGDDRDDLPTLAERTELSAAGVGAAAPPDPGDNPCAPNAEPSKIDGWICGPPAPPGNGAGAGGVCDGSETTAPCGPGVELDRYYAFTLPGPCLSRIYFDGRQWDSQLPSPSPHPNLYVWMRLSNAGELRFIAPGTGSVAFVAASGPPSVDCQADDNGSD